MIFEFTNPNIRNRFEVRTVPLLPSDYDLSFRDLLARVNNDYEDYRTRMKKSESVKVSIGERRGDNTLREFEGDALNNTLRNVKTTGNVSPFNVAINIKLSQWEATV